MEAGGLEYRADMANRLVEVAVGLTAERRRPCGGRYESEQHPQRRRLAGAVGPEEPCHPSGRDLKTEVIDSDDILELFGQSCDLYGRRHFTTLARASVSFRSSL